jgi:hypothetical protein
VSLDDRVAAPGTRRAASEDQPNPDAATLSGHLDVATANDHMPAGTMRAGDAGSVDDADDSPWTIEIGSDVIGSCGHKVGEVVALRDDHVVVEKGFFMPIDFYIPKSAIRHNDVHGLYLNVSKDYALHEGWDIDPEGVPGHDDPASPGSRP